MNKELKEIIEEDKIYYYGDRIALRIYRWLTHNPLFQRGRYIIIARKVGYYQLHSSSLLNRIMYHYYCRKKHVLGEKLHIELGPKQFGRRLRIYHNDIVVNAGAIIGDDCELYGNNCIGNKGSDYDSFGAPSLGNCVSLGVGATVIGKINIADNVKISSMSLVNKSISMEGTLYGGIPAEFIKNI